MTLEKIIANGAQYALNEITGEMVRLNARSCRSVQVLVPGETSPVALCSLLFDNGQIAENWSPLSNCEAQKRYSSHGSLLGGCIACQRL